VKLGLVFGSVVFLIAGITLAGNSQEVTGLSDFELTNIAASAPANATAAAMEEANKLLEAAKNASAQATQTGIEQAKSVMANVANNVSNATSNTTGKAMNEANKLISAAAPNATGNATAETQTYENRDIGIRLSYPSYWGGIIEKKAEGCLTPCLIGLGQDEANIPHNFTFSILKTSKEVCYCNSLKDYVKKIYQSQSTTLNNFSFISDNQTMVGKKYPSWKYEYSFTSAGGNNAKGLSVATNKSNTYYLLAISYLNESESELLPKLEKVFDSIEFLPIESPKRPSFLNVNETETEPSSMLESSPNELQILSHNSFTDSIGSLHVVGEVQNNSPSTASYVEVTGTFYDNNNQVVGTQFTYTNPSDIAGGDKAPFDLTLLSASIPTSQIDHYNLVASSQ
jgi:hypothetical protein